MAKGISLHIGLNRIDPASYATDGALADSESSARDMQQIAAANGFSSILLLTQAATRDAVKSTIRNAASKLKAGDTFLITASCHGDQLRNINRNEDGTFEEPDFLDETWWLFDKRIIDNELNEIYANFSEGVKIVVFSDSCSSGTVVASELGSAALDPHLATEMLRETSHVDVAENKSRNKIATVSEWQEIILEKTKAVKASGLLISAAQDGHNAYFRDFTSALMQTWNNGQFNGHYPQFYTTIAAILAVQPRADRQHPNYFLFGNKNSDAIFKTLRPFSI